MSLNIEPDKVEHSHDSWMVGTHLFYEPQEFKDRIFVACKNLGDRPLLEATGPAMEHPEACEVRLVDFVSWAISIGWDIPGELAEIADAQGGAVNAGTDQAAMWPWGDHETELLRMLAAAAHQFWSTYDPDQPSTAPRSEDVRDWLIDHGVSRRVAEVMAQILRPKDLPTGPRRG